MTDFGKILVGLGLFLVVLGAVVLLADKLHLPLGRLPGDISWRSKSGNSAFYFPIVTCIVLSLVFTILSWLINLIRK